MAQTLFTVEGALKDIGQHMNSNKVGLMFAAGVATEENFAYRFKIVRDAVTAVSLQIQKIRQVAIKSGCKAVLDLLDEQSIPSGHDFEALALQDRGSLPRAQGK